MVVEIPLSLVAGGWVAAKFATACYYQRMYMREYEAHYGVSPMYPEHNFFKTLLFNPEMSILRGCWWAIANATVIGKWKETADFYLPRSIRDIRLAVRDEQLHLQKIYKDRKNREKKSLANLKGKIPLANAKRLITRLVPEGYTFFSGSDPHRSWWSDGKPLIKAWYSTRSDRMGGACTYLTADGEELRITEVSNSDEPCSKHEDLKFVGYVIPAEYGGCIATTQGPSKSSYREDINTDEDVYKALAVNELLYESSDKQRLVAHRYNDYCFKNNVWTVENSFKGENNGLV